MTAMIAGLPGKVRYGSWMEWPSSAYRPRRFVAIRTKTLIRRDPTDHWVITIGKRATTGLMLANDQMSVPAGVPFILSLGDFSANQRDLDSRLQLNIARDKFGAIAPALDAARGRAVSTPLGGMLAEYIRLLERQLPNLTDEDAHSLPQAVAAMVAACVTPSADRMTTAHEQISATLKDKARRCILQNLRSHNLGPNMLCRELGMSRSSVYRLLEAEGGVARYIQRHRLAESFAQLSDPSNTKPIFAIAGELGMLDPPSFSRAFRQQFGMSPTDVREAARAGVSHLGRSSASGCTGRGMRRRTAVLSLDFSVPLYIQIVQGSRTQIRQLEGQGEIGARLCRLAFRSHVRVLLRNKLQRGIIGEKPHLLRPRRSRVLGGTPQAPDSHSHDEHSNANGYEVFGHLLGLHIGCQAFKIRAGLAGQYAHDDR